jgi:hypothetical protein
MEEYKEADRKSMVDIVIEQLGLNSAVIKLIQPTSLNTDHVSSLLCTYHGEVELFEIIKKRLIEMKR